MKVAALALVLLAVGTHAASVSADANSPPSQLQYVRDVVHTYLTQLKESLINGVDQLDDAEYKDMKPGMKKSIEDSFTSLATLQGFLSPYTDSIFNTIAEFTADIRTSIHADINSLIDDTKTDRKNLREVIIGHLEEYWALLKPITKEYYEKNVAEMVILKDKLGPILTELKTEVQSNLEETKNAAIPILDTIRPKVDMHLQALHAMIEPQFREFQEYMTAAYSQFQGFNNKGFTDTWEKIAPLVEQIRVKIMDSVMKEPTN